MQQLKFLVLILFLPICLQAQLRINEVCSDNETIIIDEYGDESDWVELYNAGSSPINLDGYYLSDKLDDPQKWQFPVVAIMPNSYLLIFASENDSYDTYAHTNFKLSKDGEELILSDPAGVLIDQINVPALDEDHSYGRLNSNATEWTYFDMPTPGSVNDDDASYNYNIAPTYLTAQAFYNNTASIELECESTNCEIRFTTDGSPPEESDILYTGPFEVDTTICIRARTFSPELLPSGISTKTFFVNVEHDLPVLALTTDPFLLYDWEEGIFMKGPDADSLFPYFGANFWEDVEIPLHLEYFKNNELVANFNIGTKIHGGKAARSKPMKALRFLGKTSFGDEEMTYPFFEDRENDSYKRLVLRNASGDFNFTHFRDAFMHRYFIEEELDLDVLAYQPVVAYLNGKFWGVTNLREKIDKYYLRDNHGADINNVEILEEDTLVVEGDFNIFTAMHDMATSNDLAEDAIFAEVEKNFDVKNIADFVIAQTTLVNTDWPNNNIKYWREKKDGAKWRYILFDLDAGMGRVGWTQADEDLFGNMLTKENFFNNKFVNLFKALIQNNKYRNYFINRQADLVNTTFTSENLFAEIDKTVESIDDEMVLHFQNWTWPGYDVWHNERLPTLYRFMGDRPMYARQYTQDYFDLENQVLLQLNVYPSDAGTIQINTITPDELPWEGYYYNGVPVTLTIIPKPGYTFRHWESTRTVLTPVTSTVLTQNFAQDDQITAFFEAAETPFEISISPNPVTDLVQMNFILDEISPVSVNLYDVSGRLLQTYDFGRFGGGEQSLSINTTNLPSGVYIIEARTSTDCSIAKIIK